MPTSRRATAFSLVELLVVISIIAVLLALTLPSMAKARAIARTIRCAANEKQVAIALSTYASDSNDFLPHTSWRTTLVAGQYLPGSPTSAGSISASLNFRCPIDIAERPSADRYLVRASYVGNIGWKPTTDPLWVPQTPIEQTGMFPAHASAPWVKSSAAKVPVETILFMEMYLYTGYVRFSAGEWQDSGARSRGWSAYFLDDVYHDSKANIAFADGHVQLMPWSDTHAVGVVNTNSVQGTGAISLWNRR